MNRDIKNSFSKPFQTALSEWCKNLGDDPVSKACKHILLGKAKHIRSHILFLIAHMIDPKKNVTQAAIGIEMLQSASLIADDLPSMDNAELRRGQKTVHIQFGADTAILASYQLLFHAYDLITQNADELVKDNIRKIIHLVSTNCIDAVRGQKLDLEICNPSYEKLVNIIEKKTSTLFYISLALGFYLTDPNFQEEDTLKEMALHLGLAFQILDDLFDTNESSLNILSVLSLDEANKAIQTHLSKASALMQGLGLQPEPLFELFDPMLKKLNLFASK